MAKNLELKKLKKMVLEQQASLSGMKGELSALGEERKKLEQEVIPVAETEETKPEITEIKEEIAIPEETPENTEVKQEEIKVIPEPEKIPENKPKTKAEKRAENRKKNGIEEKPKKEEEKIAETREKVLASMEPKEEEPKNLDLEEKKYDDKDTLEPVPIKNENIDINVFNNIAIKRHLNSNLTPEEEGIYLKNKDFIDQLTNGTNLTIIQTLKYSSKNALTKAGNELINIGDKITGKVENAYNWLKNKFQRAPKTEKIVISDEEIAANHPETVINENKENKKAEYAKRLHETLSITDMGAAYGIERAKMATDAPETQEENKKPKKESGKEREARLKQEFIEKVQNTIDIKMAGEWKGASENERAEKAKALYISEKQIFDKEKIERAGIFTKSLNATENWWKNLEDKKGGKFWKTAISSSMVGIGVIGGGLLTGSLEANAGKIAWRLASRVGLATGLNSMLASNRMKTIISGFKPKDQADIKKMKYVLAGTGIAVSGIMGGWVVAGIAAGGYGAKIVTTKIMEYAQKKNLEEKMEAGKLLKSEDFKDGYDRNKMITNFSMFNEAYTKLASDEKFISRCKTLTNYLVSVETGMATLAAMTPSVAHAENHHSHTDNKLEDKIQEQPAPTKSDSTNIDQKTAIDSSQIKPIDQNTTAPITNPEPKAPEIEFTEVKAGDGVTQTLKRLVDEDKVPKWVLDELGKNPKADDYAKFAEKFGMLHAKDFEDSIRVSKGDSFGFDEKENFIWKHGSENYKVIEIDKNGDAEEGDWMDKMQDEKFVHSLKGDGKIGEWKGGGAEAVKNYYENQGESADPNIITDEKGGPNEEKIDPNKIVEPEKITSASAGENSNDNTLNPETKTSDTHVEKLMINHNPYNLDNPQMEYINNIYKYSFMDHVFENSESQKWWSEISNTKSATDFLNLDSKTITDDMQKKLLIVLKSIHETTKLEPMHATVLNPEIPNETISQYIMRGLQYSYVKGNLNEINIEARPITI